MSDIEFYKKQLTLLVNGRITAVVQDIEGEFFGLNITTKNKEQVLWLLSDDEANSAGSFEIQEIVKS
jgi:hypothetical protein